jgi:hypothetical protein
MQAWSQLFAVTGASAATLLGLLFVSVSIHASGTSGEMHRNSKLLADQAFQNYLSVLLVSLLALFPSLSIRELGYAVLGLTALRAMWAGVRMYRATMSPYGKTSRLSALRRQSGSVIGFGLLLYAATYMALGLAEMRTTLAIATVVLLFAATTVAWELLLRIAAEKNGGYR